MKNKPAKAKNENLPNVIETLAKTNDFVDFSNIIKTEIGEASDEVIEILYQLIHSKNAN